MWVGKRPRHPGIQLAVGLGILGLGGIASAAPATEAKEAAAPRAVPFVLSSNSVLNGIPLKIGDLSVVTAPDAEALMKSASPDKKQLERCGQVGSTWLRLSDDGHELEYKPPFGTQGNDKVLVAYCDDTTILLGGFRRGTPDDASHKRATIFSYWSTAEARFGPAMEVSFKTFSVGSGPEAARYRLNEVRAFDTASHRVLFAASSMKGESAFLAAPYALDPTLPKLPTPPGAANP